MISLVLRRFYLFLQGSQKSGNLKSEICSWDFKQSSWPELFLISKSLRSNLYSLTVESSTLVGDTLQAFSTALINK